MASLIPWLAGCGARDSSGNPVASGKVWFFDPGTNVPQTVYTSADESATISQPLVLDAAGRGTVYTKNVVDILVENSSGAAIGTLGNANDIPAAEVTVDSSVATGPHLSDALTQAVLSFGGPDFQYLESPSATPMGVAAWMSSVQINVKSQGAKGDGLTVDTTAIQKAINRAKALTGSVVYFPPGVYLIDNPAVLASANGVSFLGSGPASSIIKNTNAATNALTLTSCNGFYIRDLGFAHSTSSTAAAIQLASCGTTGAGVLVDNLSFTGHRTALGLTGTTSSLIVSGSSWTTPGSSALERGIAHGSSGSVVACWNTGAGQGIDIELTSSGSMSLDNNVLNSGTGSFKFNASYTGPGTGANTIVNNTMFSAFSYGGLATEPANTQLANNQGLFFNPTTNLFSGNTLTPDRSNGALQRYAVVSTGVAYTINVPTPSPSTTSKPRNLLFTLVISNQAAGAITAGSGLAAGYHVSAQPSLVDGQQTSYIFRWDPESNVWRELSRSVTS